MGILKIGLIGCGAIGKQVLRLLAHEAGDVEVCGILVRPDGKTAAQPPDLGVPLYTDLDDLLRARPTMVVECAGHGAVDAYGERVLSMNCDLTLVSVGALANADRYARLQAAAVASGRHIFIPAGAVGGLDVLQAAKAAGLDAVHYRSRKPPVAWRGSPAERAVDLNSLSEAVTFYRGNARQAAADFPKNANVAATIALSTLGMDDTRVELIADPNADGNYHEIEAAGAAGTIHIRIKALTSPHNPSTSLITAYSVVHAILHGRRTVVL
ncbi:MAG TPA: aspartate dehydrogenase [Bordetella sp.]|nr:aspartate dehydrogenase [Bordetella sp.]